MAAFQANLPDQDHDQRQKNMGGSLNQGHELYRYLLQHCPEQLCRSNLAICI